MTATPPAPTYTVFDDPTPCPRIEVQVSGLDVDAETITVYRWWGGKFAPVRGAQNATVSGDFFVVDYEVPFGVDAFYTCVTYDNDGVPSSPSDPSDTNNMSSDTFWLQDPVDPSLAVAMSFTSSSKPLNIGQAGFSKFTSDNPDLSVNNVVGQVLPIAMMGVTQAASNIPMSLYCATNALAQQVRELLQNAFPICVRATALRVPQLGGLAYIAVPSSDETRLTPGEGSQFDFTAQMVVPPAANVLISPRSWDPDVLRDADTWDDLVSLYSTWLAVERG